MSKYVVFTYDLKTPPGNHTAFRKAMEALDWKFELDGKALPNTTAWKEFDSDDCKLCVLAAKKDVVDAIKSLPKDKLATLDRVFFLAFARDDFHVDCS